MPRQARQPSAKPTTGPADEHVKAVKKAAWERALFETHPGTVAAKAKGE